jgi:hypothetical protein
MANEPDRIRKLAVLIDAENASPRIATGLFEEIAKIGEASVRRIYGDFSVQQLKGWKDILSTHAIMPHQNFPSIAGKNASDIALVIDAMDLLHSGHFDGFCLVSSDSDFTHLAVRIREHGLDVFGFGEKKTPESFRQACKRFIYTENLLSESKVSGSVPKQTTPKAVPLIMSALSSIEDEDGWYHLGGVGTRLIALYPDFDPRTYGCSKLVTLLEKTGAFEVRRDQQVVLVKPKKKPVPQ